MCDKTCVCVECLIGKQKKPILFKVTEPSSVPYRAPSACAKMAASRSRQGLTLSKKKIVTLGSHPQMSRRCDVFSRLVSPMQWHQMFLLHGSGRRPRLSGRNLTWTSCAWAGNRTWTSRARAFFHFQMGGGLGLCSQRRF